MRNDRLRLLDIVEAIEKIGQYTTRREPPFFEDELVQVWVVHHIQIIGEAAANLSEPLRERYSHIPWSDIVAMRNVLVHHYFGIDVQEVWNTVTRDLPRLREQVTAILEELPRDSEQEEE